MAGEIELEQIALGKLTFKIREGGMTFVDATPFSDPFVLRYTSKPGDFSEELQREIIRLQGNPETINAYLSLGLEVLKRKKEDLKGGRVGEVMNNREILSQSPWYVERAALLERRIQLYSIPSDLAREHREFIASRRAYAGVSSSER